VGFEEDMMRLKQKMKQLETEYEQWFSGALPKPPWETQKAVENIVRFYSRNPPPSLAEQSVFQMHQAKYNVYSEMWNRRIRLKEEGRLPTGKEERVRRDVPPSAEEGKARERDSFQDVFDSYVAAKQKTGQSAGKLSYDNFKRQLQARAQQLRVERGYKDVDFGVSIKDGKVSLVARRKK
jgi:hypothetical protein